MGMTSTSPQPEPAHPVVEPVETPEPQVGVGPWSGALPDDSRFDPELLAGCD